ncbi:HAMP domain-containing histidine kinase [Dyadobacter sp. CY261]|uniref:sensor histidine kinase n=1 Tax=Dyadobacter sp. CY261 TaxID=2907203 RepID=UPI001F23D090|nr:HAMP domain-containing sensor histidine kinase [Dyadobacter sp. CY261]MCF0069127.1 HAMP domain-containing histidine kinase [Dyadobacter sp. CY261]
MPLKDSLYRTWIKLSGDPSVFPLNARIFHSVCLISIFALIYNIPFNYAIGLPKVALVSLVVLLIAAGFYYASRFKHMVNVSTLLCNVVGLSLFTVNYFLNAGMRGPTDLFFLLFLLLSIAISPADQYKVWIPVNVTILIILNLVEFYYPHLVPDTYTTRSNRFVDHMSAYVVVATITYFCIHYIRGSYEREKELTLENSKAIELQNWQIVRQNEELEKLNAEKNKLMSIVAHDLRSPLASIQNFLELLTQHELDEEQKLDIENDLLNSTKNTMAMLSKLLDWSKSQLHGVLAHMEQLNVHALFEPTLTLERNIAARKNISLAYYFDPSATIYADSDMMQLILRNIIGNAIKFTHMGGHITVKAEVQGNNCLITVKDDGIGMSPEKQQSIFSLNVESTFGTDNEKGVGLGLMLCMEFIKAQNGKIWLESTPDQGSCFYISVPMFDKNKARQRNLL